MGDISKYRELCHDETIAMTRHGKERCFVRQISLDDIEQAILNGEIIESYPDDTPFPSVLILGYSKLLKPIHIVVSTDNEMLYIITAYKPNKDKWEDDLKTRKE